MYVRLGKAFYFLSAVFFLIAFLYIYSASPEYVTYELSARGLPLKQVSKEILFYLVVGVFLVSNVLLILPAKLIETQYTGSLKRVFPVGDPFRDQVLTWVYTFTGVVNISTIVFVFYLHSITNQNEIKSEEINFFFYLVPILYVVWIAVLFYLLAAKIKQVKTGPTN
ncbi:DNA topoisomerase IV subunit B [Lunatimonas lonarensis]|uniref:DNA topoisomerase IV subunit B n=1 Tax=Lunatimonas lonarensis TaxID=1232681 RepID=R7ZXD8_9BACT|nr:hypothetical protein [Lunatimonas lonarensis]EON78673.1 DNA topoisomerase IV subunit B [Lunatimonas lonarensis]